MADTKHRIAGYVREWRSKGYPDDIPDAVPLRLMQLGLAPSYEAICVALLSNDIGLRTLGFSPGRSAAYTEVKRIEIARREAVKGVVAPEQFRLFA